MPVVEVVPSFGNHWIYWQGAGLLRADQAQVSLASLNSLGKLAVGIAEGFVEDVADHRTLVLKWCVMAVHETHHAIGNI